MRLYHTSFTYIYRDGSQFTETLAKPLNVGQLTSAVIEAKKRKEQESNIVEVEVATKIVGDRT